MKSRNRQWGTAFSLVGLIALMVAGFTTAALALAPALLLLVILSLDYFPGENAIGRLRRNSEVQRALKPHDERTPHAPDQKLRIGRLIAYAMAVRPPPSISVKHT